MKGVYLNSIKDYLDTYPLMKKEHFHDFYSIALFTSGKGSIRLNERTYPVEPNTVFMIAPEQMHSFDGIDKTEGIVFFFCQDFYVEEFSFIRLLNVYSFVSRIDKTVSNPSIILEENELKKISGLFDSLKEEYKKPSASNITPAIIRSILNLILLQLYEIFKRNSNEDSGTDSVMIHELSYLIDRHYIKEHSAGFYACAFNISEKQLNETCSRHFNSSLKRILTDRLIQEARRLLLSTDMTISEISYKLNFTDDSYFNKVFKKRTRLTPKRFREIHRKMLP